MELRNEPNVSQNLLLKRLIIVSSVLTVILAAIFFSIGNLSNPSASRASSVGNVYTVSGNINSSTNNDIFDSAKHGDTIKITGTLNINANHSRLENKAVAIVVDGGQLQWTSKRTLRLHRKTKIILLNSGVLNSNNSGNCNKDSRIFIGGTLAASCDGKGSAPVSFSDINSAGGINFGGVFSVQNPVSAEFPQTFIIEGGEIDDDEVEDAFVEATNGDTLKIVDNLEIDEDSDLLKNKDVVIVLVSSNLIWDGKYKLELGEGARIILSNGSELEASSGECHQNTAIFFGSTKVVSCNGQTATNSFADVNAAGEVDVNGVAALPVDLIKFDAILNKNIVELYWVTASEINNSHFEVQRSADLKNWEVVGIVQGNGNANHIIEYRYSDPLPNVLNRAYYRLRQVDFDAAFEFSPIRVIDQFGKVSTEVRLFPNPADNQLNIETNFEGTYEVLIIDMTGKPIISSTNTEPVQIINTRDFPNGMYTAIIRNERVQQTHKFLIRH